MKSEEKVSHMPQLIVKRIVKLKPKALYQVTINEEEYKVTDDIIVKYSLTKNKELTEEIYQDFLKDCIIDKFYVKVCKYIYFKFRSEYEIREYLKNDSCKDEDIEIIIDKLKAIGLINDKALSQMLLDSCVSSLKGPNNYLNKIYQKRISDYLNYEKDDEEETLVKALNKIKNNYSKYPVNKQKTKIYEKLLRDGFTSSLILSKLSLIELEDDSLDMLEKDYEKAEKRYSKYDKKIKENKITISLLRKGYKLNDIKKLFSNNL